MSFGTPLITEAIRVQIRDALGFSGIFLQADPTLENAITTIASEANGGSRPDNTSELEAISIVNEIAEIYCEMKLARKGLSVLQANKVKIDAARAIVMLRSEGRRLVTRLSALLSTHPRRDIFSASEPRLDGTPFPDATNDFRR